MSRCKGLEFSLFLFVLQVNNVEREIFSDAGIKLLNKTLNTSQEEENCMQFIGRNRDSVDNMS